VFLGCSLRLLLCSSLLSVVCELIAVLVIVIGNVVCVRVALGTDSSSEGLRVR
jgi:hypothetical protein